MLWLEVYVLKNMKLIVWVIVPLVLVELSLLEIILIHKDEEVFYIMPAKTLRSISPIRITDKGNQNAVAKHCKSLNPRNKLTAFPN
jgi:hypothetical protein